MGDVAVAAPSRIAADAGAATAPGGGAVDAAIAAAVVAMCTEVGVMAPGGSGFVTVWPPGGDPVVVDGYAEMPGRGGSRRLGEGLRQVHIAYGGGVDQGVGYGSVATPGMVAALGAASARYGRLSWARLLEPAIRWTDDGFTVSKGAAEFLVTTHGPIFSWQRDSYEALHDAQGRCVREGDTLRLPDLSASLRELADDGATAFYTGRLGRRIAAYVEAQGGLLTAQDLAAYAPVVRPATVLDLDDFEVATNPPPAIGGACMAAILLLLRAHEHRRWDEELTADVVAAQRAVLDYRSDHLDGVAEDAQAVRAARALLDAAAAGDLAALRSSPSTIHVSAVDTDGWGCAVTASAGYGSGVLVPGTGIWLNNSLGEVDLHPQGLEGLAPGTRLASNMAPTVARGPDGVLAVGSPGASRITTAIAQVLYNHLHLDLDLDAAIRQPRLHVEMFEGAPTIAYEHGLPIGSPEGYRLRVFDDRHMFFGGVGAARLRDGALSAAADDRRGGAVAVSGGQAATAAG